MNERRTFSTFAVASLVPIALAHACLAPFWLTQAYAQPWGHWLPSTAILLTAILVPAYLALLGWRLALRGAPFSLAFGCFLLPVAHALSVFLDYLLWGVASGHFFTPDDMTVVVIQGCAAVGLGILAITLLVAFSVRFVAQRASRAA